MLPGTDEVKRSFSECAVSVLSRSVTQNSDDFSLPVTSVSYSIRISLSGFRTNLLPGDFLQMIPSGRRSSGSKIFSTLEMLAMRKTSFEGYFM